MSEPGSDQDRYRKNRGSKMRLFPRTKIKNHRSLMNLYESEADHDSNKPADGSDQNNNPTVTKDTGRRSLLNTFFRRGTAKKVAPDPATLHASGQLSTPINSRLLTGNLGIGEYIGKDENVFLNCEGTEENTVQQHGGYSKSMVDLSTIASWLPGSSDSVRLSPSNRGSTVDSDHGSQSTSTSISDMWATSVNTRSQLQIADSRVQGSPFTASDLLRVLFFTEDLLNTGVTANRSSGRVAGVAKLPAWLITEDAGLIAGETYMVYRTADYQADIHEALVALGEQLPTLRKKLRAFTQRQQPSAPVMDLKLPRSTPTNETSPNASPNMASVGASGRQLIQSNQPSIQLPNATGASKSTMSRAEMQIIHKTLSNTASYFGSMKGHDWWTSSQSSLGPDVWIVRRTSIDCKSREIDYHNLLPRRIESMSLSGHSEAEVESVYREQTVQLFKLTESDTSSLNENLFYASTLILTSTQVLLSDWLPKDPSKASALRLQSVLPLSQIWCGRVTNIAGTNSTDSGFMDFSRVVNLLTTMMDSTETSPIDMPIPTSQSSLSPGTPQSSYTQTSSASSANQSPFNQSPTDLATASRDLFVIGCAPADTWLVRFPDAETASRWQRSLARAVYIRQLMFNGRCMYLKVLNQLTNNQIVYKYQKVSLVTTAHELLQRTMESMNIGSKVQGQLLVRYTGTQNESLELPLLGHESPFLIALTLTYLNLSQSSPTPGPPSLYKNIVQSRPTSPSHGNRFNRALGDLIRKPLHRDMSVELRSKVDSFEEFVQNLMGEERVISADQVHIEFILRVKEKAKSRIRKSRLPGLTKPSEIKRSGAVRQKEKSRSSWFLHIDLERPPHMRTAQSTGCLTSTSSALEIYGRDPAVMWADGNMPYSIVSLFVILYYLGHEVEGIFRRTPRIMDLETLRIKLDENCDPITPENCSPIMAAALLKRFFSEIPKHLLDDDNWDAWIEATQKPTSEKRIESMLCLIKQLPKVRQTLLNLLIHLLAHIRDHESTNRMSTEALGTVWGPNLIQNSMQTLNPEDAKLSCQIVISLLDPKFTATILAATEMVRQLTAQYEIIWNGMSSVPSEAVTASEELPRRRRSITIGSTPAPTTEASPLLSVGSTDSSEAPRVTRRPRHLQRNPMKHFSTDELMSKDRRLSAEMVAPSSPDGLSDQSPSSLPASPRFDNTQLDVDNTAQSSSADSSNASPNLPSLTDNRRNGSHIISHRKQRMAGLFQQSVLPDHAPIPTRDDKRLQKQASLPEEVMLWIQSPPVPPRMPPDRLPLPINGTGETARSSLTSRSKQDVSPPVPPRVKPRTKVGPLRVPRSPVETDGTVYTKTQRINLNFDTPYTTPTSSNNNRTSRNVENMPFARDSRWHREQTNFLDRQTSSITANSSRSKQQPSSIRQRRSASIDHIGHTSARTKSPSTRVRSRIDPSPVHIVTSFLSGTVPPKNQRCRHVNRACMADCEHFEHRQQSSQIDSKLPSDMESNFCNSQLNDKQNSRPITRSMLTLNSTGVNPITCGQETRLRLVWMPSPDPVLPNLRQQNHLSSMHPALERLPSYENKGDKATNPSWFTFPKPTVSVRRESSHASTISNESNTLVSNSTEFIG